MGVPVWTGDEQKTVENEMKSGASLRDLSWNLELDGFSQMRFRSSLLKQISGVICRASSMSGGHRENSGCPARRFVSPISA